MFVKHGSFYIRVHPCRLQLKEAASRTVTPFPSSQIPSASSLFKAKPAAPKLTKQSIPLNIPASSSDIDKQIYTEPNLQEDLVTEQEIIENDVIVQEEQEQVDDSPANPESSNEIDPALQDVENIPQPSETSATGLQNHSLNRIKPGIRVKYVEWEGYPENEVAIISRAGKASTRNKNWWNTDGPDGAKRAVDFAKVYQWEIVPETLEQGNSDEMITDPVLYTTNKAKEMNAKITELQQWKDMGVYEEVNDEGQDCISLRWVLKDKVDDEGNTFCKARLCVRGFEEEQDFRTDSPTCSREGVRLFLSTTVSNNWTIHSIDVKGAFLQGKELDRKVDIKPPKEAETT